jgi:predicted DNA-binding protein (MmcQ/YjbR family)
MNEEQLRALTKAWPGVEAGMKWEDDLVFTVAGKMFCVTCIRGPHEGSGARETAEKDPA